MDEGIRAQYDANKILRAEERANATINANASAHAFGIWCNHQGLAFSPMNNGLHWRIAGASGVYVDWWPSTGRGIRYPSRQKFRAESITALREVVTKHWGLQP